MRFSRKVKLAILILRLDATINWIGGHAKKRS